MSKNTNITPVLLDGSIDLSADYTGPATTIRFQDNVCYQFNVISGTPVGTLDVELSLDYNYTNAAAGTWTKLDTTKYQAAVNGTGSGQFDLNQLSQGYIRLVYTRVSGSGAAELYLSSKAI